MSTRFEIAAGLTRGWVRLYTTLMPEDLRDSRRAEIDADLWDHARDAQDNGVPQSVLAMEVFLRTILGVVDDVSWRFEAIRMRRNAALEGKVPMMLSSRQIRWLGLSGMLGGILWAGKYLVRVDPGDAMRGYGHIAVSLLFIAGLLGLYAQQRGYLAKPGKTGFALIFTALISWSALLILSVVFGIDDGAWFMNVLALAFVLPIGPACLLLGIGLTGPVRRVALAIGAVFAAWILLLPMRALLVERFPSAVIWHRGDSPLGMTVFFLMGIGLALMGYTVFRTAAPAPNGR